MKMTVRGSVVNVDLRAGIADDTGVSPEHILDGAVKTVLVNHEMEQ